MVEAAAPRVFLGLLVVVAVILLFGWMARRGGLAARQSGAAMRIIDSLALGPRQRIVLLEVEDTWVVLGVTAGQITTLHSTPAGATTDPPISAGALTASFASKLGQALRRN